mgnify:CR=1 FL=1
MDFEIYGIGAVALTIALVQFAKKMGFPKKYLPVLAVVVGIIEGFVAFGGTDPAKSIVVGLVVGLTAIGVWSGAKNVAEGVKKE